MGILSCTPINGESNLLVEYLGNGKHVKDSHPLGTWTSIALPSLDQRWAAGLSNYVNGHLLPINSNLFLYSRSSWDVQLIANGRMPNFINWAVFCVPASNIGMRRKIPEWEDWFGHWCKLACPGSLWKDCFEKRPFMREMSVNVLY